MIPSDFEEDLFVMGYEPAQPKRKIMKPDPKLIEIMREQTSFRMMIPAATLVSICGLLFAMAID